MRNTEKKARIGLVENDAHFARQVERSLTKQAAAGPNDDSGQQTGRIACGSLLVWESAEVFWRDPAGRQLDLLLLDIVLPNMSGVELAGHVAARDPRLPLVMLTNMNSDELIFQALRNGASGYILKTELRDLPGTLATILEGGAIISPTIAFRVLSSFKKEPEDAPARLTARERSILDQMASGDSVGTVAATLGIARTTVEQHVKNIYRKLNVHSRAQMVRRASDLKLLRY